MLSLYLVCNLSCKWKYEWYHQEMGEVRFHFLWLHKLESHSESACVLYAGLVFNMHKTHCLTAYCEFVESQISHPNWEKGLLAYRNAPILLSRQNFYKYHTRINILKSIKLYIIKNPRQPINRRSKVSSQNAILWITVCGC